MENSKPTWQSFLIKLGPLVDTPIVSKDVRKILKINDKQFPTGSSVLHHYQNKFSKETNQDTRSKWHSKDKLLLVWCALKLHELDNRSVINPTQQDWDYLSNILDVRANLLNLKWLSLLKTTLKDAPWTEQEDLLLLQIVSDKQFQKNWTDISLEFNRLLNNNQITRYAKQIRERWNNYLDPSLKRNNWDNEERHVLFELVKNYGKKWSKISKRLSGRTENQVKNHYHSVIRNIQKNTNIIQEQEIVDVLISENELGLDGILVKYKNSHELLSQRQIALEKCDISMISCKRLKVQQNSTTTEQSNLVENVKIEQEIPAQIPLNLNQFYYETPPQNSNSMFYHYQAFWSNWQKVQNIAWHTYLGSLQVLKNDVVAIGSKESI